MKCSLFDKPTINIVFVINATIEHAEWAGHDEKVHLMIHAAAAAACRKRSFGLSQRVKDTSQATVACDDRVERRHRGAVWMFV